MSKSRWYINRNRWPRIVLHYFFRDFFSHILLNFFFHCKRWLLFLICLIIETLKKQRHKNVSMKEQWRQFSNLLAWRDSWLVDIPLKSIDKSILLIHSLFWNLCAYLSEYIILYYDIPVSVEIQWKYILLVIVFLTCSYGCLIGTIDVSLFLFSTVYLKLYLLGRFISCIIAY